MNVDNKKNNRNEPMDADEMDKVKKILEKTIGELAEQKIKNVEMED